jgi:hypothetical protein
MTMGETTTKKKSVKEIVEEIKNSRGQFMSEVVWDMFLNDFNGVQFNSVISELEQIDRYRPDDKLAIRCAQEIIKQFSKYYKE